MGSANLAGALISGGLVDEYRLMIEPVLLGGGKRLFPDDGQSRALELVSTSTSSTGVHICTYRPLASWSCVDDPALGSVGGRDSGTCVVGRRCC